MIKSDLEYKVTTDRVQMFQNSIQELNEISERGEIDSDLIEMQMNGLTYNISVLKAELSEYEYTKSQEVDKHNTDSIEISSEYSVVA